MSTENKKESCLQRDSAEREEYDISEEMNYTVPMYKYAEEEEILGGFLVPFKPAFAEAKDAALVDELPCTDCLMNMMAERIPEPAPYTC